MLPTTSSRAAAITTAPRADAGALATHFGTYYPTDYVVAVLPTVEATEQAARAARALPTTDGTPRDVATFSGEEVLALARRFHDGRGLLQRFAGLVAADERDAQEQFLTQARCGRYFVAVLAPHRDELGRVRAVLERHGAAVMRHYGPWAMTDLRFAAP